MKQLLAIVTSILLGSLALCQEVIWTPEVFSGIAPRRSGATVALNDTQILYIGGFTPSGETDEVLLFDRSLNTLTQIGNLPIALQLPAAVALDANTIIVVGGINSGNRLQDVYANFNGGVGQWQQISFDFPGSGRFGHFAFRRDATSFLVGSGSSNQGNPLDLYLGTVVNQIVQWELVSDTGANYPSGSAGGYTSFFDGLLKFVIHLEDEIAISSDALNWSIFTAPFRRLHDIAVKDETLFVFGGKDAANQFPQSLLISQDFQVFEDIGEVPFKLRSFSLELLDDSLIVIGGADDNDVLSNTVWIGQVIGNNESFEANISSLVPSLESQLDFSIFHSVEQEVNIQINWTNPDTEFVLRSEQEARIIANNQQIDVSYKNVGDALFTLRYDQGSAVEAENITIVIRSENMDTLRVFPIIGTGEERVHTVTINRLPDLFVSEYPTNSLIDEEVIQIGSTFQPNVTDRSGNLQKQGLWEFSGMNE